MEREKNPSLRTKILLGHRDLKLNIKQKGNEFYKRVSVEYFGKLPTFNFTKVSEMSPGSPTGRRKFSSEEEEPVRARKRIVISESESPKRPEPTKPRIEDISHDYPWDGF